MKKLAKEESFKLIDKHITSVLKRTPAKYWHEILDKLEEQIKFTNRMFICECDKDRMKKFFEPI